MGSSSSSSASKKSGSSGTSATSASSADSEAPSPPPDGNPVILHVYKPVEGTDASRMPGVYHSGVEVYGSEYYFGGGTLTGTGVRVQRPMTQPRGSDWTYDQSLTMDYITLTRTEVRDIVNQLRSDWQSADYHLARRNCNHFSDAFCQALCGKSIPKWVNRLASIGSSMLGSGAGSASAMPGPAGAMASAAESKMSGKVQAHEQLLRTNAEYAAQHYTGPPKAIVETAREVRTDFLGSMIHIDEIGGLNLNESSQNDLSLIFTQDLSAVKKKAVVTCIESDCDEQILIYIPFAKLVKIESFGLALPLDDSCPKKIKLFINQPHLDFDEAMSVADDAKYMCEIDIDERELAYQNEQCKASGSLYWTKAIPLKVTQFSSVKYLTFFVEENFGNEVSRLFKIEFWGLPK